MKLKLTLILFSIAIELTAQNSIGVYPFESADKKLGETAAAIVLGGLAQKKKFQFVEKAQLNKALNEIGFTKTGVVREEDVMELGKLSGASYMILGDAHKESATGKYSVSVRLIRTETGIILGGKNAHSDSLAKAGEKAAEELYELLSIVILMENPDSPFHVKLKLDKGKNPKYKVGEKISLTFQVDSSEKNECFIQIFSIDSRGMITKIFPNKFSKSRKITIGKEYTFPEEDAPFEWEITGTPGIESIQAMAISTDSELFQEKKEDKNEVFRTAGKEKLVSYRGIKTKLKDKKLGDYSSERISFTITE